MIIYFYDTAFIAVMPSFAGLWWDWVIIAAAIILLAFYFMRPEKKKKVSWSEHFVEPPEYTEPKPIAGRMDALQEVMRKEHKSINVKNRHLWDDGLIFTGFMLQGTDLRFANLHGGYLRDMFLRDRNLDGSYKPLIFRDAAPYMSMDMSATYLRNEISLADSADIGRVDLSGLYLRGVGLQQIDIKNIMEKDESKFGDYFLEEK